MFSRKIIIYEFSQVFEPIRLFWRGKKNEYVANKQTKLVIGLKNSEWMQYVLFSFVHNNFLNVLFSLIESIRIISTYIWHFISYQCISKVDVLITYLSNETLNSKANDLLMAFIAEQLHEFTKKRSFVFKVEAHHN